jgi:hypothetical protein
MWSWNIKSVLVEVGGRNGYEQILDGCQIAIHALSYRNGWMAREHYSSEPPDRDKTVFCLGTGWGWMKVKVPEMGMLPQNLVGNIVGRETEAIYFQQNMVLRYVSIYFALD